jgi:1-deoxy-D-xylulose-5-phosphate reductoisomerase
MPAVLNAANEVAVEAFLSARIGFRDIHRVIEKTMEERPHGYPSELQDILEIDAGARRTAAALIP